MRRSSANRNGNGGRNPTARHATARNATSIPWLIWLSHTTSTTVLMSSPLPLSRTLVEQIIDRRRRRLRYEGSPALRRPAFTAVAPR